MPEMPSRRLFLHQALVAGGVVMLPAATPLAARVPDPRLIDNVTQLYSIRVARVVQPVSVEEVIAALKGWPGQVSVGGGRYSMGGQVALPGSLHLDLRELKRLVWLRVPERQVRVQAGMRWRDLQDLIDPQDLAVKTMQSYANFTVGGAVSVNAHGRYVGNGPVAHSVRALQLVLADGRVVEASRDQNSELFKAAIGGYGAVGVITEVELELVPNTRMERQVESVPLADYPGWFRQQVHADSQAVLHNADLIPPRFDEPLAVTWRRTDKALTVGERLTPRDRSYSLEKNMIFAMTELPGGASLRKKVVQPLRMRSGEVVWRNHEASLDVAELAPRTRAMSTYVLQEYFIPPAQMVSFAKAMAALLIKHEVKALNVSIRHSPADEVSLLPWAKSEVFSFVLFYKQRVHERAQQAVGTWTRALIDLALQHGGRYYLPYQLHATQAQFDQAYPEAQALKALKRQVDPQGRLSNALWAKYLS